MTGDLNDIRESVCKDNYKVIYSALLRLCAGIIGNERAAILDGTAFVAYPYSTLVVVQRVGTSLFQWSPRLDGTILTDIIMISDAVPSFGLVVFVNLRGRNVLVGSGRATVDDYFIDCSHSRNYLFQT